MSERGLTAFGETIFGGGDADVVLARLEDHPLEDGPPPEHDWPVIAHLHYGWTAHIDRSAGDIVLVGQRYEPDGNWYPAHQRISVLDVLPPRAIYGLSALDTPDGRDGRGNGL